MITKYLKSITVNSVSLYSGRADFNTVNFTPYELKLYSDIVIEDEQSLDYNKPIFDEYIRKNILTTITIIGPDAIPEPPPEPPGPVGLQFLIIQAPGNILGASSGTPSTPPL